MKSPNETRYINTRNQSKSEKSEQIAEEMFRKPKYPNHMYQIIDLPNEPDTLRMIYQTIFLLRNLKHQCILRPESIQEKRNRIVMKYKFIQHDLQKLLKSPENIISEQHVKIIFYQIVMAIGYLHAQGISHCNLRPEKILLTSNSGVRLVGLENSHFLPFVKNLTSVCPFSTDYYMSPEILLNQKVESDLAKASDVWGLGCILFEMLSRKQVFHHKRSLTDLLFWMMKLLGKPNGDLEFISNIKARYWLKCNFPFPQRKPSFFLPPNQGSELVRDLLDRILVFDPRDRLQVFQILGHSYFKDIYRANDLKFEKINFDFETFQLRNIEKQESQALKNLIFKMSDKRG